MRVITRRHLIILCTIAIAWVLVSVVTQHLGYNLVSCPSRLIYDIPCAGCGGTRAFLLLVKGHPLDAFFMNPNVYPAVMLLGAAVVLALYDAMNHTDLLNHYCQRFRQLGNRPQVYVPVLICELAIWAYNIWRYTRGEL